jgi:membrane-bound serine protease (ClpP class)
MRLLASLIAGFLAFASVPPVTLSAQPTRPVVYVAPIEGMIDLGVAPFVQRVLREAERDSAAAVVFEINTFGGRVDAAVVVRDALLSSKVPTIAFINRRAISAGALIALAANTIAITKGGTIGAATPVQMGAPGAPAQPVEEKTVSYVRKEFRSTAESRNRPALVAEAMVDSDIEIDGLIAKGKLLTLTTDEALAQRIADFQAESLSDLLAQRDLAGADIRRASVNWAEQIVRFLTNPIVSSLLVSVALLGILVEIRTPGIGFAGIAGVVALTLYLGGHWIVQLAGWEELLLIVLGLGLVAAEVFIIPGFGVAGVGGILALIAGLSLSVIGAGATGDAMANALGRVMVSTVLAAVAGAVLMRFITRTPLSRALILDTDMSANDGWASAPESDHRLLHAVGVAHSPLRPAGIAEFHGERVDVVSEGELIDAGTDIIVTRVDGNRVVVRQHHSTAKD